MLQLPVSLSSIYLSRYTHNDVLSPDVNEVPSELGAAQQSCTKHEAVTKREDNNMAQGNFMASKSSEGPDWA